jgi:hypothetical protein
VEKHQRNENETQGNETEKEIGPPHLINPIDLSFPE